MPKHQTLDRPARAIDYPHPWPWSMNGILIITALLVILGVLAGPGY